MPACVKVRSFQDNHVQSKNLFFARLFEYMFPCTVKPDDQGKPRLEYMLISVYAQPCMCVRSAMYIHESLSIFVLSALVHA
jgi:hypothetical protein